MTTESTTTLVKTMRECSIGLHNVFVPTQSQIDQAAELLRQAAEQLEQAWYEQHVYCKVLATEYGVKPAAITPAIFGEPLTVQEAQQQGKFS